jgi:hypothetical protein
MATITGMTAAAMDAVRDGMVVSADFDSANHLILTKYDGTQVDAGVIGAATATLPGVVELATSAETQTGTDTTRAVTPAGLASIPGQKVQDLGSNAKTESQIYADYPAGISTLYLTNSSGWSLNSGFGTVLTINLDSDRCEQTFYARAGGSTGIPRAWMRFYHSSDGGGGWTPWREISFMSTLTAASFTQLTALSNYPSGSSRIYYTTANGGSWDFNGTAGEVQTYYDSANAFGRQTFTQHSTGSLNKPVVWTRTSDSTTGWSGWQILSEPGAWSSWTPSWTTSSGSALPSLGNAAVDCRFTKLGRKVDGRFEITFGNTTNFGSSPGTSDNWEFGLPPVLAARTSDTIGWLQLQNGNDKVMIGRARLVTASTFRIGMSTGFADGTGLTLPATTGDVDSLSPFGWGSGHSVKGQFTYESAS